MVRLIETHVSYIFLTDSCVYKIKKEVDFGFLNFSSIDRRRFYCGEEVRLNRRLCPDLYLGVVEVRDSGSGLTLHREGKVVDYAVKMRRLPEERMLAHLLSTDAVGAGEMRQIAATIASFHQEAATVSAGQPYGGVEAIRGNWEENFRHAQSSDLPCRDDLALIKRYVHRFSTENEALLRQRVRDGFIRECDGDIHADNICLADRVYIFDCIEFSDALRFTDTAADVAFLLMDLEYHGKRELCAPFLERYLELTGDRGMTPLLNFYMAYRAFVRGEVTQLRLKDQRIADSERALLTAKSDRYFRLCRGYALRDALPPTLFITCGYIGSGKSTLAAELSFQLGTELLRSDALRKELAGIPRTARAGEALYSEKVDEAVYAELLVRAERALKAGKSVVVDATFRRAADRGRFREMARRCGAAFQLLLARCSEETIRKRLEARPLDPREISDARWEIFPALKERFELPQPAEGALTLDCEVARERCVDQLLRALGLLP